MSLEFMGTIILVVIEGPREDLCMMAVGNFLNVETGLVGALALEAVAVILR